MAEIESEIAKQLDPKQYLLTYLNQNIRPDGRKFHEIKPIILRTNTNSKCYGSSLIRWGNTIISCEILIQVGTPLPTTPHAGGIVFDVALWPICSSQYEKTKKSDEAYSLEATLKEIYLKNGAAIDLEQLCITPGRQAFCLTVQIICLSRDGSFLDSIILATSAALRTTSLPAISFDSNNRVIILSDQERKPLKISRHLVSLTCGIFLPINSNEKSSSSSTFVLLDPSTFEGDYNEATRQLTQREVVLDHIITLITDDNGNISHIAQRSSSGGRSAGIPIELFSQVCSLLVTKSTQHLFPLLLVE